METEKTKEFDRNQSKDKAFEVAYEMLARATALQLEKWLQEKDSKIADDWLLKPVELDVVPSTNLAGVAYEQQRLTTNLVKETSRSKQLKDLGELRSFCYNLLNKEVRSIIVSATESLSASSLTAREWYLTFVELFCSLSATEEAIQVQILSEKWRPGTSLLDHVIKHAQAQKVMRSKLGDSAALALFYASLAELEADHSLDYTFSRIKFECKDLTYTGTIRVWVKELQTGKLQDFAKKATVNKDSLFYIAEAQAKAKQSKSFAERSEEARKKHADFDVHCQCPEHTKHQHIWGECFLFTGIRKFGKKEEK
jgi:hypothetical protein